MLLFTVLCSMLCTTDGYRILGIFSHPGKSHFHFFEPILKALAKKGHNVTVLSHFPQKVPLANLHDVDLEVGHATVDGMSVEEFSGTRYAKYVTPFIMGHHGSLICESILTNQKVLGFLQLDHQFDVIILEFFNSNCLFGIAHKLKAPIIAINSCAILPWHGSVIGLPTNPAYIPNNFLPYYHNMNFLARAENSVLHIFHNLVYKFVMDLPNNRITRKYLQEDLPALSEITRNISLFLVNTHFSISAPRPRVPALIEVGGLHITEPNKLPLHIEKWINESTHGVIYFSMGSMIKGHTFPDEKRQMFLRAFARLPQRVLWKWETETMPGKPDNVMLLKWMPQFDILCHPNVKAFIAHGGLLGVTESVHCGVPMLLMPQFGDQFTNSKAIEANEGGIMLDFRYITEEQIYEALTKILSDSFNKKAKELSARFKDRPMPPLETAIYWVEYVARHRGAPHLRTAAVGMPLYKYLLLDVIAFLLTILIVVAYIWYRIVRAIYRKLFSSKQKVKTN